MPFEVRSHAQQRGVPFPVLVHAVEAPVVQLVERVEGEVEVLVAAQRVGPRRKLRAQLVGRLLEGRQHELAQLAARLGQPRRYVA
jgi:hypothetical protein